MDIHDGHVHKTKQSYVSAVFYGSNSANSNNISNIASSLV